MYVVIANKNFERLGLIENVELIWASRYYKSGDFELHMALTEDNISLLNDGFYVIKDDDKNNIGVIEDIEITSDLNNGDRISVVGKFASGVVLGSRVVSEQTILDGNVQDEVRNLVYKNMINASNINRNINFVLLGNLDNTIIDSISIQITGANLLEKIEEICESKGIGFKMPLRDECLYFEMYKGIDRSYAQCVNDWVIFSDEYDNLSEANYICQKSALKNLAYVAGEGEGLARKIVSAYNTEDEPKGIDRFEIWVDQRNMSSNDGNITEQELRNQMREEGIENLTTITQAFDGSISLNGYEYGKDLFLGDIVSIKKRNWNMFINARIIECIESYDVNGKTIILTFGI